MKNKFITKSLKSSRMIRQILIASLFVATTVSADTVLENQKALSDKVDSIDAKRGLSIGGSIRANYVSSSLSSKQDVNAANTMPDTERDGFVSADLLFQFRPWEEVRVNAMLRLEAGMQNYFTSAAKSISAPWLNVEGNIGNSFYWVVGDFREQYTPLTLFAPDVEILYEPKIFARDRAMARSQALLEGNQRNLQGVNLQYRNFINGSVGELRVEGIFSRLRRVQVMDFSGAEGNILPNEEISGASQASNMDKWLVSGNLELLPLNRNLMVATTGMYIFDDKSSFSYAYLHENGDVASDYVFDAINPYDTDAQNTKVFSVRAGADVAGIMNNKNLLLDVTAEFAYSMDDVYSDVSNGVDTITTRVSEELDGTGLLVTLNGGYQVEKSWGVRFVADVVRNDSNWFNNLAQSPQFFASRVANSDKDGNTAKYGVNSSLYSTFDALYHYVPKFSPAATSLGTDDGATANGQTESYNIADYSKTSWTSLVYTRSEIDLINSMTDPAIQLTLPNGLATSNRLGARGKLIFNLGDYAEAQGLLSIFTQVKPLVGYKAASFTEYGGGAKVDVFKMLGFTLPLELSGSYKHSERSLETDVDGTESVEATLKSDFINAGVCVQYLPRLGVTAGFQYIITKLNEAQGALNSSGSVAPTVPLMRGKQMQWMVGLDYTLAADTWLSLSYGVITVENTYNTTSVVASGSAEGIVNLPDYYDVTTDETGSFKHKFTQSIIEASINVEF